MNSIYDYSIERLENKLEEDGGKKYRARQIYEWIYKKGVNNFLDMSNIGKKNLPYFEQNFTSNDLKVKSIQESKDGTVKFLYSLSDGNFIETVLMRHEYGNSVCVSTQVGCNMGCAFCASGMNKKVRDLEVFEMVLQVKQINDYLAETDERVSHVVIMGIGEPFDNYYNVMDFIRVINNPYGMEIGARHITLSTCGLVPAIKKFKDFPFQVNLAVSLHFPNDILRKKYMPIANSYNLSQLLNAVDEYFEATSRRITFEYILLDGINDNLTCAKELVAIARNRNCYINLIPMNEASDKFRRSTKENTNKFYSYLQTKGVNCTLRREYGSDIDAACGQLRIKVMKENHEGNNN
ncbi:MAG: 23S rRNA (adenine(2503)-C(2))-methyltransferase RlmN [Bacilli bacterium]